MCAKNCCTNATRHTIIFFSILSLLLLLNTFNFSFNESKSASSNKSRPAKDKGTARDGSSSCNNTPMATLVTPFIYGVLFAALLSITFIVSVSNRTSSWSNYKINTNDIVIPDSRHHYSTVGPNLLTLLGPTLNTDGDIEGGRGRGRGIELRTLPTFAYSKMSGGRMGRGAKACVICQSRLREGQMVRWLPECDHLFHLACIDEWLAANSTCPCCRANVNMNINVDDAHNFHYDQHAYGFPS